MSQEQLVKILEGVRAELRKLEEQGDTKELEVCQHAVNPILRGLGWQDSLEVRREFPVTEGKGGKRNSVDYALCLGRKRQPRVFLEVKDIGKADKAAERQFRTRKNQLFGYIYDSRKFLGVTPAFGVLTDGKHWHIYLSHTGKTKQEPKRIWSFNLAEDELSGIARSVYALLNREEIKEGQAQKNARQKLREKDNRDTKEVISSAWKELIKKERSPIVEALIGETRKKMRHIQSQQINKDVRDFLRGLGPTSHQTTEQKERPKTPAPARAETKSRECSYILFGQEYTAESVAKAFVKIIRELHLRDTSFLDRLAQDKPSQLKKNKEDFPDYLARRNPPKEVGSWWITTHTNTNNKKIFLKAACKVAGIEFGEDLVLNF